MGEGYGDSNNVTVRAFHVVVLALETPRGVGRLILVRICHEEPSVHSSKPPFHSILPVTQESPQSTPEAREHDFRSVSNVGAPTGAAARVDGCHLPSGWLSCGGNLYLVA